MKEEEKTKPLMANIGGAPECRFALEDELWANEVWSGKDCIDIRLSPRGR